MKNIRLHCALLAAALMAAVSTHATLAAGLDINDQAVLVPYANDTGNGFTTTVGITTRAAGTLYWAFFDQNGNRRARGDETLLTHQRFAFIWSTEAAAAVAGGPANTPGYLLFAIDTTVGGLITGADSNALTAGAFFVNLPVNDVAYIPTMPIDAAWLSDADPDNWTNNPITQLAPADAIAAGATLNLPYLIAGSPNDGEDTKFYVFTTASLGSTRSMTVHDGDGASKIITVQALSSNLNILDPETVSDITPAFYGDGMVRWTIPAGAGGPIQAFAFSVIESDAFGAAQTLDGGQWCHPGSVARAVLRHKVHRLG